MHAAGAAAAEEMRGEGRRKDLCAGGTAAGISRGGTLVAGSKGGCAVVWTAGARQQAAGVGLLSYCRRTAGRRRQTAAAAGRRHLLTSSISRRSRFLGAQMASPPLWGSPPALQAHTGLARSPTRALAPRTDPQRPSCAQQRAWRMVQDSGDRRLLAPAAMPSACHVSGKGVHPCMLPDPNQPTNYSLLPSCPSSTAPRTVWRHIVAAAGDAVAHLHQRGVGLGAVGHTHHAQAAAAALQTLEVSRAGARANGRVKGWCWHSACLRIPSSPTSSQHPPLPTRPPPTFSIQRSV